MLYLVFLYVVVMVKFKITSIQNINNEHYLNIKTRKSIIDIYRFYSLYRLASSGLDDASKKQRTKKKT